MKLPTRQLPAILQQRTIAQSRLFTIEELQLRFANGVERTYERLCSRNVRAVMIIPMIDNDRFYLIREYAAGINRYELALPKGIIDKGEDALVAANRELQEEVGMAAQQLDYLITLTASPGYFTSQMDIVLAQNLTPSSLPGDEPETIEVIEWRLSQLPALIASGEISEARSIAALYLARDKFSA
jgi:ADP-ribose diphosphatase